MGPFVGGVITDTLGWEYLFMVIFLLSVIALVLSVFITEEYVPRKGEPIDWKGAAGWGV